MYGWLPSLLFGLGLTNAGVQFHGPLLLAAGQVHAAGVRAATVVGE
jgi:hypothetical protein